MTISNLPALQIVVPLLAGPLCVLLRREDVSYGIALVASWASFAMSVLLLMMVIESGPISFALGGWEPPWGIEYRVDSVNAYVLLIVAAIGAVVITYARPSVAYEIDPERRYLFYTAYLLCLSGLLGVTITGDAFNVFVFLEISSLSSYVLISLGRDRKALTAALSLPDFRDDRGDLLLDRRRVAVPGDRYAEHGGPCRTSFDGDR